MTIITFLNSRMLRHYENDTLMSCALHKLNLCIDYIVTSLNGK